MRTKGVTRCIITSLAVIVLAMAIPGMAVAQLHGAGALKGCDPCVTPGQNINCTIAGTYIDGFGDVLQVTGASDTVNSSGGPVVDPPVGSLPLDSTAFTGNAVCCAGPSLPCYVGPSGSTFTIPNSVTGCGDLQLPGSATPGTIFFKDNQYTTLVADAPSVSDSATVHWNDLCTNSPTGCNTSPQNATAGASTTVCVAEDACHTAACDGQGNCVQTPISCDDGNACTADSCDPATGCVHTAISCDDGNACTADSCDPATGCAHTAISCDDGSACTTDSCDPATGCVHTAIVCDDNDVCTDDTCDPATGCVFTPNDLCQAAICRTPGFWGTHAGVEKTNPKNPSQNITQTVINSVGSLSICGDTINNTNVDSVTSAVEAICVSPSGNIILQLARQLTAAALNCVMTNGSGSCVGVTYGGSDIGAIFAACNNVCTGASNAYTYSECIGMLDCFNNGGVLVDGVCTAADPAIDCHLMPLCSEAAALCFEGDCSTGLWTYCSPKLGPAGSSNACNMANDNSCTIIFGGCSL